MKSYKIGIARYGPYGLAAALLLARQEHDVVLFECFDRPQP
jgi:2-polyprenyl-6-methoxyphenol hydroxylase-like FAD-dependent oxidoreductase